MKHLDIHNPFSAPVFHEEIVDSTMNYSRSLFLRGENHGTIIAADFQKEGRGRVKERLWEAEKGKSLMFTIMLHYPCMADIPAALTLRTGLAVALAIEDFMPPLSGRVMLKWPNDVLVAPVNDSQKSGISAKKLSGILAEAENRVVYIGIGVNVLQKEFSACLRNKATSIAAEAEREIQSGERFLLLEKILLYLHKEIEEADGRDTRWRQKISEKLYKKGLTVSLTQGVAGAEKTVTGTLYGIGSGGELLIIPKGETKEIPFVSGELTGIYR